VRQEEKGSETGSGVGAPGEVEGDARWRRQHAGEGRRAGRECVAATYIPRSEPAPPRLRRSAGGTSQCEEVTPPADGGKRAEETSYAAWSRQVLLPGAAPHRRSRFVLCPALPAGPRRVQSSAESAAAGAAAEMPARACCGCGSTRAPVRREQVLKFIQVSRRSPPHARNSMEPRAAPPGCRRSVGAGSQQYATSVLPVVRSRHAARRRAAMTLQSAGRRASRSDGAAGRVLHSGLPAV